MFAIFATLSMLFFKQFGVGLAAAILIDATIVRAVLLPATMKLLGDWNWYLPRWLEWLPRLDREEEGPAAPVPPLAPEAAGEHLVERPRVEDVLRPRAAAPGRRDRQLHVPEAARRVRVGVQTMVTPASRAMRTCSSRRSSRSGSPFTSTARPCSASRSKTASRSTAFGGRRLISRPVGWLRAADVGRVERREHALRQLLARSALAAVDARLHPVELGEHVVGEVERAVPADVALGAAQERGTARAFVGLGDLLGLPPTPSASRPGTAPTLTVWSQIAR